MPWMPGTRLNSTLNTNIGYINKVLEKSTYLLVITNTLGCRASENLDAFQWKVTIFTKIIFVKEGKYTLVNVYVDLVVFTRIAGTS